MRQKTQLDLAFPPTAKGETRSPGAAGTEARASRVATASLAAGEPSMEAIVGRDNLRKALAQVRRNKGAPGIDGMTVDDLALHLKDHWPNIRARLLDGTYRPLPVRRVEIPKASGGMRPLGIPTVLDRFIQQAVLQVLQAAWDPTFSEHSHGFRPGRSAHGAVRAAQAYIAAGDRYVVDIDLEKFFDRVNHDILMGLVAKRVVDRRILRLIRGFLTAGVLADGLVGPTDEGTPQGGPLSPLLSNVMLDVLDRELERRGHRFARYADDCNIYVRSRRAGERVMANAQRFLARRLKLKVNAAKSAVDPPSRRKFLGFSFTAGKEPRRRIAPQALAPEPGSGADAPDTRDQPRADRRGPITLSRGMAWLLRLLRNPIRVAQARPVGQATAPCHRLDAMEARTHPLCGAAPSPCRKGPGGQNRRKPARPVAAQQQPRADHGDPKCLPGDARSRDHRWP